MLPEDAVDIQGLTYVREGRAEIPMRVSPPYILWMKEALCCYSDEFITVRSNWWSASAGKETLLKALSLYLSSDFVTYQQFFTTSQ